VSRPYGESFGRLPRIDTHAVELPSPLDVTRHSGEPTHARWRALGVADGSTGQRRPGARPPVPRGRTDVPRSPHVAQEDLDARVADPELAPRQSRRPGVRPLLARRAGGPITHRLWSLLTAQCSTDPDDRWSVTRIREYLRTPTARPFWPNPKALAAAQDACARARTAVRHSRASVVRLRRGRVRQGLSKRHRLGGVLVDYVQRLQPHAKGTTFPAISAWRSWPGPEGPRRRRGRAGGRRGADRTRGREGEARPPGGPTVPRPGGPDGPEAPSSRPPRAARGRERTEADCVIGIMNYRADFAEDVSDESSVPDVTKFEWAS